MNCFENCGCVAEYVNNHKAPATSGFHFGAGFVLLLVLSLILGLGSILFQHREEIKNARKMEEEYFFENDERGAYQRIY